MPDAIAPDAITPDANADEARSRSGVAAVVLAAGSGSRFAPGYHKLRAEIDGVSLLCRAVEAALVAAFDETIVITGANDFCDLLPSDVTIVRNERWSEGQATSLQVAVAYAGSVGHRTVVFGLADQPGIPASAWTAVGRSDHDLVVASFDGLRCPPVRIGAALWCQLPSSGDEGARVLFRRRPELLREIACAGNPADIDTVEDLEQWKLREQRDPGERDPGRDPGDENPMG